MNEFPRWVTEHYEGCEADIAATLQSAWYNKLMAENKDADPSDLEVVAANNTRAILAATQRAYGLQEDINRAFYTLAWQVANKQLYHFDGEVETLGEWLLERLPNFEEGSSVYSDMLFILQQLFPVIQSLKNGLSVKKLLSIKENWTRARAAVPFLRNAVNQRKEVEDYFTTEELKLNKELQKLEEKIEKEEDEEKIVVLKEKVKEKKDARKKLKEQKPEELHEADKTLSEKIKKALDIISQDGQSPINISRILKGKEKWDVSVMRSIVIVKDRGVEKRQTVFLVVAEDGEEGYPSRVLGNIVEIQDVDLSIVTKTIEKMFKKI